jgi:hypothetical protein
MSSENNGVFSGSEKTYGEHHILLSIVQSFSRGGLLAYNTMHHIPYEEIQYIEQQK